MTETNNSRKSAGMVYATIERFQYRTSVYCDGDVIFVVLYVSARIFDCM